MPGIPKRERKNQSDVKKNDPTPHDVESKLGKEPITVQEIMIYLNDKHPDGQVDVKTIKNRISSICEKSKGLLSKDDFKTKKKYVFLPQYHGLLLCLLDTSLFDNRKNDRKLSTKCLINSELVRNIENYLINESIDKYKDGDYIKKNMIYLTATLEDKLLERINIEASNLLRTVFHIDAAVRWNLLVNYLDVLYALNGEANRIFAATMTSRMLYAHEIGNYKDAKGIFKAESIEDLLISLLAHRVHNNDGSHKNSVLSLDGKLLATYLLAHIFGENTLSDSHIKKVLDEIDININNEKKYIDIQKKAEKILNLSDSAENNIYDMLMFFARMTLLKDYAHKEEYQSMQRYMESAVKYTMLDLVNKLLDLTRNLYTAEDEEEHRACKEWSPAKDQKDA